MAKLNKDKVKKNKVSGLNAFHLTALLYKKQLGHRIIDPPERQSSHLSE